MPYLSRFEFPTEVSDQSYKDHQEFLKNLKPSFQKRLLISSLIGGVALSTFATTLVYTVAPNAEPMVYAFSFFTALPTGASIGIIAAAILRPSTKAL